MKPYCVIAVRGGWKWLVAELEDYEKACEIKNNLENDKNKRIKAFVYMQVIK